MVIRRPSRKCFGPWCLFGSSPRQWWVAAEVCWSVLHCGHSTICLGNSNSGCAEDRRREETMASSPQLPGAFFSCTYTPPMRAPTQEGQWSLLPWHKGSKTRVGLPCFSSGASCAYLCLRPVLWLSRTYLKEYFSNNLISGAETVIFLRIVNLHLKLCTWLTVFVTRKGGLGW